MSKFFVPYYGDQPAAVSINGHRLIILSRDKTSFEEEMEAIGADNLKALRTGNTEEEESRQLNKLAKTSHAGVVIAPGDLDIKDVIKSLEVQLPWLQ